ncbi:MAG: SIR2 family protein, partial [Clostridia bacterium]|nr:SIR2 family protein [Clostridia bacterium]
MYKEQLKRILEASQKNALTFFVGAGVSTLSGTPTWKDLINAICDEMGYEKKENYSSDEYLQIPQMLYYSLNQNEGKYTRFVKKQLGLSDAKPNCIHREMLCLNPVSFITTKL